MALKPAGLVISLLHTLYGKQHADKEQHVKDPDPLRLGFFVSFPSPTETHMLASFECTFYQRLKK